MMASEDISSMDALSLTSTDDDILLAHKIFASRPTGTTNLMPKGGLKYSVNNYTEEEAVRLRSYYKARETLLSTLKVRKLSNLGLAEWIPELSVAKITRQGKFMQSFGFPHENDFFALYPEEALFLLDVGDIELKYKGALISLQDAFALLICTQRGSTLCTIDEYCVYAHLCRMGYRVQRFYGVEIEEELTEAENSSSNKILDKRKGSPFVDGNADLAKKSKLSDSSAEVILISNESQVCGDNDSCDAVKCRGWWIVNETKISETSDEHSHNPSLGKTTVPNLAFYDQFPVILPKISDSLLPENTCSWKVELERIWYERLKKDTKHIKQTNVYSYPKYLNCAEICRCANDWTDFKALVKSATENRTLEMENLYKKMNSGDVKPLIHPGCAGNMDVIYENLQIFKKAELRDKLLTEKFNIFNIRFNVFMTESDKPFRKSKPGKPLIRVCVVSSADPMPNFADTTNLSIASGGVPVKIALVNSGKVLFLGFDDIDIPVDKLTF